jgi:TRAP-type C4-dicarboxylate transport system permease small subunit
MNHTVPRLLDYVYLACIWIAGLAIVMMSLIIPWGIYARYVLGSGSSWPEPVAVLLMVTFTFFGAAATYRASGHIAVGMLTDKLPRPLRRLCARVVDGLMVGVCTFVIIWGAKLSLETMRQALAELPWLPVGYTYLPLPIGTSLILLFVLEQAFFGPQNQRAVVTYDHEPSAPTAQAN